ncbi:MAG: D-alanyl-D-alanine carboxypeptidase [Nitrospiraceae bacterium]|nr:D-alanyl-D-alanine carboxypeptidase [Nitrospiraceae bacterium]
MKFHELRINRNDLSVGAIKIPASLLLFLIIWCASFITVVSAEEITSRAAVAMDAATGRVLYAKNPDNFLMPASTTKLMTALVVLDHASLSDVVTVSKRAAKTPPTKVGLKAGDRVTIETLLEAALIKSANDAAVALAEAVAGTEEGFVDLMNKKAVELGAENTRFINANGLPGEGQHITAYDLAKIMRVAIQSPVLREILNKRVTEVSTQSGRRVLITNTNKLLWHDEDIVGGKTGYTRQARHCLVCVGSRENETVIVAVLGAPSRGMLWKESENLMVFGSKVMNHQEEPEVYLTKSGYEPATVTKASHTKKSKKKKKKKKKKRSGHTHRHTI